MQETDLADADLTLSAPSHTPLPLPLTTGPADDRAQQLGERWHVAAPNAPATLFPPFESFDGAWAAALDPLPGVEVSWSSLVCGTPFGDVGISYWVEDGMVTRIESGFRDDLDVWFRYDTWRWIASRTCTTPVAETLAGGDFSGDLDMALLVAGLQESDSWRQARLLSVEQAQALRLFADLAAKGALAAIEDLS